jgi:hypothetical protein
MQKWSSYRLHSRESAERKALFCMTQTGQQRIGFSVCGRSSEQSWSN